MDVPDATEIAEAALRRVEEVKAARKHNRRLLGAIGFLLCVGAAAAIVIFPINRPSTIGFIEEGKVPLSALPLPDENARPYGGAEINGTRFFEIPGYDRVTVSIKTSEAKMLLPNPKTNPCRFIFEVVAAETNETLYLSGLVEPGMCLLNPTFHKTLSVGEHEAVLFIHMCGQEGNIMANGANVGFTLVFE